MDGKRGWASRTKGEDLRSEEDNEQARDISRHKCRKTLSLLSTVHRGGETDTGLPYRLSQTGQRRGRRQTGVSSWGFLQNTSPRHQRHPVKK